MPLKRSVKELKFHLIKQMVFWGVFLNSLMLNMIGLCSVDPNFLESMKIRRKEDFWEG